MPLTDFSATFSDLNRGVAQWRIWSLLAISDVRQRYRRSSIGEFWITLSMLILIIALGLVYSQLLNLPAADYIPYLAVSLPVWYFVSAFFTEGATVFISSDHYLRHAPMPLSLFVLRLVLRNLITLGHNIVIIPLIYLYFMKPFGWTVLLFPLGLLIVIMIGFWSALLIGLLSARYRDVPQMITNVMQIMFFISPVTFGPGTLPPKLANFLAYNPFTSFLGIMRAPLTGEPIELWHWQVSVGVLAFLTCLGLWCFSHYRNRVIYWL